MTLGWALFLFANIGVVATTLLGLIDQASLRAQNRKLRKEVNRHNDELTSLREMVTMERGGE
jgi:hypothetical protein